MTKLLIKLYLQLEKFWSNPVVWLTRQPWIVRFLSMIVFIPLIAASSIVWYAKINTTQDRSTDLQTESSRMLQDMSISLDKINQQQLTELKSIKKELADLRKSITIQQLDAELTQSVLGTESEISSEVTSDDGAYPQLVRTSGSKSDKYPVYTTASSSGKKSSIVTGDTIYFFLTKDPDWYELDLGQGQTGWIQAHLVQELPE